MLDVGRDYRDITTRSLTPTDGHLGLAGVISEHRPGSVQPVGQRVIEGVYRPTDVDCLGHPTTTPRTLLGRSQPM